MYSSIRAKVSEDLLWRLYKKLPLTIGSRLVERRGNGFRLSASTQLLRWSPVGTPRIERIENNVLAIFVIEPQDERKCQRKHTVDGASPQGASKRARCLTGFMRLMLLGFATSSANSQVAHHSFSRLAASMPCRRAFVSSWIAASLSVVRA